MFVSSKFLAEPANQSFRHFQITNRVPRKVHSMRSAARLRRILAYVGSPRLPAVRILAKAHIHKYLCGDIHLVRSQTSTESEEDFNETGIGNCGSGVQKSSNSSVKDFGAMMDMDHSAANE